MVFVFCSVVQLLSETPRFPTRSLTFRLKTLAERNYINRVARHGTELRIIDLNNLINVAMDHYGYQLRQMEIQFLESQTLAV